MIIDFKTSLQGQSSCGIPPGLLSRIFGLTSTWTFPFSPGAAAVVFLMFLTHSCLFLAQVLCRQAPVWIPHQVGVEWERFGLQGEENWIKCNKQEKDSFLGSAGWEHPDAQGEEPALLFHRWFELCSKHFPTKTLRCPFPPQGGVHQDHR